MIVTPSNVESLLRRLEEAELVTYDVETDGLDPYSGNRIIGLALRIEPGGRSYYLPFRHRSYVSSHPNLPPILLADVVESINASQAVVLGFNTSFDLNFTKAEGVNIERPTYDVMVAAHLNNENESSFALKSLADKYVYPDSSAAESALLLRLAERGFSGKDAKGHLNVLTPGEVGPYAEQDVNLTYQLLGRLLPLLRCQGLYNLWLESADYTAALTDMMWHGALINQARVLQLQQQADTKCAELTAQLRSISGLADLNPRSTSQMAELLGLASTKKSVLKITQQNPLIPVLQNFRAWDHARKGFYTPFLRHIKPDGRIHCRLNQIGTISGRLSASSPNMQGLAKEHEEYHARETVVAPEGCAILACDYSQIELRILAYYTQSPFLLRVYADDRLDLHGETAKLVGIDRDIAKRVNFGSTYGIGSLALAELLGIPVTESERILERYHRRIPEVKRVYHRMEQTAEREKHIVMWTGRRRHYGPVDEFQKALSNLIQGGVGEIMRIAISRLHKLLRGMNVRMFLQVHDEILFEGPEDELLEVAPGISRTMEDFQFTNVPIRTEMKIGPNWGNLRKLEGVNAT